MLTGTVLLHQGLVCLSGTTACPLIVPQTVGAVACALLLVGFLTPLAGMLVAVAEGWILCLSAADPVSSVTLGALGATLAMIGPGAWSIDARLFGRRHIDVSEL